METEDLLLVWSWRGRGRGIIGERKGISRWPPFACFCFECLLSSANYYASAFICSTISLSFVLQSYVWKQYILKCDSINIIINYEKH